MSPAIRAAAVVVALIQTPVLQAQPATTFPDAKHGHGELTHVRGVPVVVLRGTPTEIGEQFGVLAIKNAPGLDALQANFLRDAKIEKRFELIKALAGQLKPGFPPDHLSEIEAMAKVSGRALDLAVFANTVYDISSGMGCSTVVVGQGRSATGSPLLGRNFDWYPSRGITEHTLIAVFHPTGKRSFATVTISPIVGCISGMNDAGLSCTLNEVHLDAAKDHAAFNWSGTPMMLALRRVLEECGSVAEAENLLRGMKRTTAACLTVCDANGGAVFEITPKTLAVRSTTNGVCCCTNHFRTDSLSVTKRCWRYAVLAPLEQPGDALDVAGVFAELHKVHQGRTTLQSMVFEPAARTLHLKYGRTPATALAATTLDLGPWFAAKGRD